MCDLVKDAEEPLRVGHVEARHADVLLEGEPEARLLIRLAVRVRHHCAKGLFLDAWLGTHTSTMSRDVTDIHGE